MVHVLAGRLIVNISVAVNNRELREAEYEVMTEHDIMSVCVYEPFLSIIT